VKIVRSVWSRGKAAKPYLLLQDVVLSIESFEAHGLRKEIPDWLLKEGSKGGNIVMDRRSLQDFMGISFGPRWLMPFRRWR
jgi:hypothetical protein